MNAIIDHHKRKAAREAVTSALRAGDLVRPPSCSTCGRACAAEAHHKSYEPDHWLDVVWLCTACHGREHASDGRARSVPRTRKPPADTKTGPILRALRERAGLSLSEAAPLANTSTATLCRWENGRRRVDGLGMLREYARLLGATDDEVAAIESAYIADSEVSRRGFAAHDRLTTERR